MKSSLDIAPGALAYDEQMEEPFGGSATRPLNPTAWADRHGVHAAMLPEITGQPYAGKRPYARAHFGADEHLLLGRSVQETLNKWAFAGLIDGGAMIRKPRGYLSTYDTWEILIPDPSMPFGPYAGLMSTEGWDWHYIVPDPVFMPVSGKHRWDHAALRAALKRGDAAVMTFGQMVFLAGDLVGSFADLHKPNLYKQPQNLMKSVQAVEPLSRQVLLTLLRPQDDALSKYLDLVDLEDAGKGNISPSVQAPELAPIEEAFAMLIETTPYGALQLAALMLSRSEPVPWAQIEALAPWLKTSQLAIARLRAERFPVGFLEVVLTNGHYLELAYDNFKHFAPDNWKAFEEEFGAALQRIEKNVTGSGGRAGVGPIPAEAIAQVAFACHFLTDAFSAGHMRVPRAKLGRTGGIACKVMHDLDGEFGLVVKNGFGDRWRAYGDGDLDGPDKGSVGAKMHSQYVKQTGANNLGHVLENLWHATRAVVEAVALMHYDAHRYKARNPNHQRILQSARTSKENFLADDLLLARGSRAKLGSATDWQTRDVGAKLKYLRNHRPDPVPVGKTWDLNHPPLLDANGKPDGANYSRNEKMFGKEQFVVLVWRGMAEELDITEMYHLSRVANLTMLKGVQQDTSLFGVLNALKELSTFDMLKRIQTSAAQAPVSLVSDTGPVAGTTYQPNSRYAPVVDATLFHCAPTPPAIMPCSLLPIGAVDAVAETRAALRNVGLGAAQVTQFENRGGVAALTSICSFFGGAAFAELLKRLRYTPAQLQQPPNSYQDIQTSLGVTQAAALLPRVLLAIPGYFRELARRAPNIDEAFAVENLGWLVAQHLRATAGGSIRWWLPPAPSWVTPFPNPPPALSAPIGRLVASIFDSRQVAPLAQYQARCTAWRSGLPGRLWARETGAVAGSGGPGRAWYPDLVAAQAADISAEKRVIQTAWEAFRDGVEKQHGPNTDAASTVLAGSCHDSIIPTQYTNPQGAKVPLFGRASLRGLQWTLRFPLRQPTNGSRDLRSETKILAALAPTTERLMATMAELGWNDLVFHTAGSFCVRGRRRNNVTAQERHRLARLLSNHGSATAIDLNVFENPASGRQTTFDARVVALFESFNFRWGACFNDPHHFEYG